MVAGNGLSGHGFFFFFFYLFQDVIDKLQEDLVYVEVILGARFTEPHPGYLLCKLRASTRYWCVCVCVCARACWARRGRHVSSISTGSVTGRGNSSWALGFRQRLGRKVWKVLFILKCKAHLHLNFNVGKCSNFLHDEKSAKHKL